MTDKKITELTELTAPAASDIIVIVDDPGGSPVTKKMTVANLVAGLPVIDSWTPDLQFGGAKVGITYSAQTGYFAKIGRMVVCTGYMVLTSKGSSTGAATIAGLPETIADNDAAYSAAAFFLSGVSSANTPQGYGPKNTKTIAFTEINDAGAYSTLTDANFVDTSWVMISFTYFTS